MPQKVQKYMNTNELSKTFGKFYVRPVYPKRHIGTNELAEFIQTQCTVKMSDIKAVLVEIGSAFKHYFELGQKIKLDGVGIFKVGISSACSDTEPGCNASLVKKGRVNFQPEVTSVLKGVSEVQRARIINGVATLVTTQQQVFDHPATMLKDVRFELTADLQGSGIEPASDSGSGGGNSGGDDEPRP